jgi:hypothetical protein
MESVVSVYVDWAATEESVRVATEGIAIPAGVTRVSVTGSLDTLGCRVAVDIHGSFDAQADGLGIARRYAARLSDVLGVPAFALNDLILVGSSGW